MAVANKVGHQVITEFLCVIPHTWRIHPSAKAVEILINPDVAGYNREKFP
jgi:hypothetical protein